MTFPSLCLRCRPSQTVIQAARLFSHRASSPTEKFSLAVTGQVSKVSVTDRIKRHVLKKKGPKTGRDAVVILASRDFVSWLEDEEFMAELLRGFAKTDESTSTGHLDVLAGATDGLNPVSTFGAPRRGFSILSGSSDSLLPGLWEAHGASTSGQDAKKLASTSFIINPLPGDARILDVTVPLANTVFQNGRQSTLLASRWQVESSGSLVRDRISEKRRQTIVTTTDRPDHAQPFIPLVPITEPRRIIAGLGNIIRQTEVDGIASPASKELEAIIPKLFQIRSQSNPGAYSGAIGVWALICPSRVVEDGLISNLQVYDPSRQMNEYELASESAKVVSNLFTSGCRLHKILGGGGGWGLKQGLLSLDPETSYTSSGEDDIESFIKSFTDHGSDSASNSVVTIGSYVQFFVEPASGSSTAGGKGETPSSAGSSFVLGFSAKSADEVVPADESGRIELLDGHFSAITSTGLYLQTRADLTGLFAENTGAQDGTLTTKIDVSGASVMESSR